MPRPDAHPVDQLPRMDRLVLLGVQHVLVMYAGCVAVPIVVGGALNLDAHTIGLLVNADLFVAGIATVLQSVGVGRILGSRLPVVAGATFAAVNPMIIVGARYGLAAMYGALICAGIFGLLVAYPFSRVLRFFPPLVTGTVITAIGLSLISAATGLITGSDPTAKSYAQPSHIGLAAGIVGIIVFVTRFGRGLLGQTAVLIGIIAGTLIAAPMHLTDFSAVGQAGWFGLTRPFRFGEPRFEAAAIISMCVVMLVTYTESTADMLAVGEMVDRPLSNGDIARGLAVDGLSAVLGGIFNSFTDTAYAQNVGLVGMTRIRSRYVVAVTGVVLIALGLVPKIGAIVAGIPGPVVGGAALVMFAMVTAVGIRTLHRVPLGEGDNLFVVAVSLGVGLAPVVAPNLYEHFPTDFQVIFGSSITSTVIVVFVLNLFFHHLPAGRRGLGVRAAARAVEVTETVIRDR